MSPDYRKVYELAERAHRGRVRQWTGDAALVRPLQVALVASQCELPDRQRWVAVRAALLYEAVEGGGVTEAEVGAVTGGAVLLVVREMLSVPNDELVGAGLVTRKLKLIDRTINLMEMKGADPDVVRRYVAGSEAVLAAVGSADHQLATNLAEAVARAKAYARGARAA